MTQASMEMPHSLKGIKSVITASWMQRGSGTALGAPAAAILGAYFH